VYRVVSANAVLGSPINYVTDNLDLARNIRDYWMDGPGGIWIENAQNPNQRHE
jgi:hypothetical protein